MTSRPIAIGALPRTLIAIAAALATGGALGAALGWLAWYFWVIGLAGLVLGLAVGWALAVLGAWLGGPRRLVPIALAGIVAGFAVREAFEDAHQRKAYRVALAETRAAETGLSQAEAERLVAVGGLDYLAADGDELLEAQVEREIGFGGPAGRWLFRAEGGVRLAGSWRAGRALPVGIPGAIAATLLELALGVLIARAVIKRAGPGPQPTR